MSESWQDVHDWGALTRAEIAAARDAIGGRLFDPVADGRDLGVVNVRYTELLPGRLNRRTDDDRGISGIVYDFFITRH